MNFNFLFGDPNPTPSPLTRVGFWSLRWGESRYPSPGPSPGRFRGGQNICVTTSAKAL